MNSKAILVLVVITILSCCLYWFLGDRQGSGDPLIGTLVLPGFKGKVGSLASIDMKSRDGEVTLSQVDDQWVVTNRDNYPADFEQLGDLLDAVARAKFAEKKTSKPENFERLGLRDIDEDSSEAVEIKWRFDDGTEDVLLLGRAASGRAGQYFRFPGIDQAWMTGARLDVARELPEWLSQTVIDIESERIVKVTMTDPEGEQVTVIREGGEEEDFSLVDLPEGRELKYATVGNELSRSLSKVRLDDVREAEGFDWSGSGKAEFWGRDGLLVTVQTKVVDDKHYLGFTADVASGQDTAKPGDADEEGAESDADAAIDQVVTAEVAELRTRLEPWVFEVSEYSFRDFTKTLDDLLKEQDEEEES